MDIKTHRIPNAQGIKLRQEVDRQDINLRGGKLNANQEMLVKAYADDPMRLEAILAEMRAKIAAAEAEEHGNVIDASPDETQSSQQPANVASEQPVEPGSAVSMGRPFSPAAPAQPTGAAGEAGASVPKSPRSWRD
jgi:hypothetical protein